MIVQPTGLTPKAAYAIDQYVLGGGKALVFVDPVPEAAYLQTLGQGQARAWRELAKLLKSWGVEFVGNKVATDIAHARRVQFGQTGGPVTDYVAWLALDQRSIDQGDVLSAGIDTLNLASPGFLKKIKGAGPTVTPLIAHERPGHGGRREQGGPGRRSDGAAAQLQAPRKPAGACRPRDRRGEVGLSRWAAQGRGQAGPTSKDKRQGSSRTPAKDADAKLPPTADAKSKSEGRRPISRRARSTPSSSPTRI